MVGDKMVCERWFAKEGGCYQALHLLHKTNVDVSKSDVCYVKRRWMLLSALLARKVEVDVTKYYACYVKWRSMVAKCYTCQAK